MRVHVQPLHMAVGGPDRGDAGQRDGVRGDVQEVVHVVGGDRGDHELGGDRRRGRVGRGLHRHLVGPCHVDVAGQEDGVADAPVAQVRQQFAPVVGVAVPLVGVDRQALLGQAEEFGERRQQVGRYGAEGDLGDHHGGADQPPGGVRAFQSGLEPVQLGAPGDRTVRVVHLPAAHPGLLVPERAQVEQVQVGEPAEAQPAVGGARDGGPYGHPLEVGALGGGHPRRPVALGAGSVVHGAAGPGVVRELVVVPDGDHRMRGVQGPQVGVGLVDAVPGAVVGERDDLVGGGVLPYDLARGGEAAGRVLVEVVAEVQHRVQVAAGRQVPVRGEVARLPVGAGDDAEADAAGLRVVGGGGAGAAHGGVDAGGGEAVVVGGGRCQAAYVGLDGVVGRGGGGRGSPRDHRPEVLVGRHFPVHRGVRAAAGAGHRAGLGRDPGPQQDAVRERVAGGHAVLEDLGVRTGPGVRTGLSGAGGGGEGQQGGGGGRCRDGGAT